MSRFKKECVGNLICLNDYNFILPNFFIVHKTFEYEKVKDNINDKNNLMIEDEIINLLNIKDLLNIKENIDFNKIIVCKYFNKFFGLAVSDFKDKINYSINHSLEDFKDVNNLKNSGFYNNKFSLILEVEELI